MNTTQTIALAMKTGTRGRVDAVAFLVRHCEMTFTDALALVNATTANALSLEQAP